MNAACPLCQRTGAPGTRCPADGSLLVSSAATEEVFWAGEYRAEKKIGAGGMGEVWRGTHPKIKKQVAIKVLNKKLLEHATSNIRFKREALAVNTIRNRHIVDIFATGELADGRPYMVMEFLSGSPLSSYLKQHGPLPFTEILDFFSQLTKGLGAAHEHGIIHRDLKPDNIFLVLEAGEKPFLKLLDFGIAKILEAIDDEDQDLTAANVAFGTPAYMSPEQCKGAKDVDHRSDIYALGIILFEMVTGRTPFREPGEGRLQIIAKQMTDAPPRLAACVSHRAIPEELEVFVRQVLSKTPGDRPISCVDFYSQLEVIIRRAWTPALDEVTGAAPLYAAGEGPSGNTSQSISLKLSQAPSVVLVPPRKPFPRGVALALGAVLLCGGLGAYLLSRGTEEAPNPPPLTLSTPPAPSLPASAPVLSPVSLPASVPGMVQLAFATTPDKFVVYEIRAGERVRLGETFFSASLPVQEAEREFVLEKSGYEPISLRLRGDESYLQELPTVRLRTAKRDPKSEGSGSVPGDEVKKPPVTTEKEPPLPDKNGTGNPFGP